MGHAAAAVVCFSLRRTLLYEYTAAAGHKTLVLQVRQDIDHRSYMPAAWRVDEYLNQEEDEEDFDLASLKKHKWVQETWLLLLLLLLTCDSAE